MIKNQSLIGRDAELAKLNALLNRRTASLLVIKGRRRIGKSRLIAEFIKNKPSFSFMGLAPSESSTAQTQRDAFAKQLSEQINLPVPNSNDWSDLFVQLATHCQNNKIIIVLDEITWLAHGDDTFLSKLQNAWERYFKQNNKLILILCGSISAWIEKNILSATGYFGRITSKITLKELSLPECNQLLEQVGFKRSAQEKLQLLNLTGGVPWYMELIDPTLSAAQNIRQLCFDSDGILVSEYKYIFHDLFGKRSQLYEKITRLLSKQSAEYNAIAEGIDYGKSGRLSEYLDELIEAGYIRRTFSWNLGANKTNKISLYRLTDNYLRYYYRYIEPNISPIHEGLYANIDIASLPNWNATMGYQFETLALNNRPLLLKAANIDPIDVIKDNPYYQRQTQRIPGCQIDYLVQTRYNTFFVFEFKFSKNPIPLSIISEMQDKIKRLKTPKHAAALPILVHINGISEEVVDSGYFYRIIDFADLL